MSRTESETLSKAIEAVNVLPEAKREYLIGYAEGRADALREQQPAEQAG